MNDGVDLTGAQHFHRQALVLEDGRLLRLAIVSLLLFATAVVFCIAGEVVAAQRLLTSRLLAARRLLATASAGEDSKGRSPVVSTCAVRVCAFLGGTKKQNMRDYCG